MVSVIDMFV